MNNKKQENVVLGTANNRLNARVATAILSIYCFGTHTANAEIIEISLKIPVQVEVPDHRQYQHQHQHQNPNPNPNQHQLTIKQDIVVTVVRDTAQRHAAIALIAHGRPASAADRLRMGQVKYPGNALWLVQQGFVVIVPTRMGYGATGGPDVDYSGECNDKQYLPALQAAQSEYRQVLDYVRRQSYADSKHTLLIGESFGGMVVLAMTTGTADPGVDGVINMAGGDGGDSSHPDQPCQPERLEASFAALGKQNQQNKQNKQNQIPTRWMYSLNDRLWGSTYPRQWFDAFIHAGGVGEFIQLPADKNNGHFIFNRNVLAWHPAVEKFLLDINLSAPKTPAALSH
ncbi:alpha/beta hydrolase family protein [Undibacterium sp. SXout20W]|uniref:alpha/beta hydrolase family protein n=1 Tax=Undibacterium sp. SXout20W TaxID=3413051 RepID=UPI003BF2B9D2